MNRPQAPPLKITVLGSGTSVGVPTIGCGCAVCRSDDPRDTRLRPSVLLSYSGRHVLIDTTPDFRTQALRAHIRHLDAVIFTHGHADHVMGLDDVRPFNFRQRSRLPIYAAPEVMETIQRAFQYIFDGRKRETNIPQLEPRLLDGRPFELWGLEFTPIPILHGRATVYGFRFGQAAYLTDHSAIPSASMEMLRGLDVLFLDALRHKPHPTHSTVAQSVGTAVELGARRVFFTHICHDLPHAATEAALPDHIRLAYDGLQIHTPEAPRVEIYRRLEDVPRPFGPAALTIGNFDGVHCGHRRILERLRAVADEHSLRAVVLTFDPHPARIVAPQRAPALMTKLDERCALMAAAGIGAVVILPFTPALAALSAEQFVRDLLADRLGARAVLVGANFRYGRGQAGDAAVLTQLGRQYGFTVEVIPAVECRGRVVSSSVVRDLVRRGRVGLAARLLERPYALAGEVVSGRGIGSSQTVPTLNLATACEVIPASGVYVTRTHDLEDGRQWPSVTNIGYRPTFGASDQLTIETFLLEPLEGGAPARLRIEFLHRLRVERRFDSAEGLKQQIMRDASRASAWFRRMRRWIRANKPGLPAKTNTC